MDAALVQPTSVRDEALGILSRLGVPQSAFAREGVLASSPITGELITYVRIVVHLGHKNIQHTVRYTELSPTRFKNFWRE
jgi:hypothetical protein